MINCLAYALQYWDKYPNYKLYYNSDHVINSKYPIDNGDYLPAIEYGYNYFKGAFKGLLNRKEQALLKKYFEIV